MGIPRKVPGRGSVGMGLGSGVIVQLYPVAVRHVPRAVELVQAEQRDEPAAGPGREDDEALSWREALGRFPIGTEVIKPYEDGNGTSSRPGQVYDFYSP